MTMLTAVAFGQQKDEWQQKFEQIDPMLPTPNDYRSASGAPGPEYWQQKADYSIKVAIDDNTQKLTGSEVITYTNNSPDELRYVWVQLDQNVREQNSLSSQVSAASSYARFRDTVSTSTLKWITRLTDYDGGFKLMSVKDMAGNDLKTTINYTMMRVDLPKPIKTGEQTQFQIDWWYNINDRAEVGGRGGMEYFPEDDNYVYTMAQWFPRMAVYDDVNGWQNKQFLGTGEFALPFGDYEVEITVPSDHVVASTGVLQNSQDVLTKQQMSRFEEARNSEKPVLIVTQAEAEKKEKKRAKDTKTWVFKADNVRDFAFASSRKFIWDAMGVQVGENKDKTMAMSFYPKEGNPLWEEESTYAVRNTLITYSRHTIDYPYPVAISVHAASIGMEYPMICFNFGRPNPDGTYNDRIKKRMLMVIVHEVGHNFFPMIINSDERQWKWMDEGINSFVEHLTCVEWYPELNWTSNTPKSIKGYMKGDYQRPLMTSSDNILQPGPNGYTKPAAALLHLREVVMGPELFDYAFKEYARRWAFKHPKPADFFRTMEDASAVDLDWFWRGWFYSTDHVDVSIDNVRWFQMASEEPGFENRVKASQINISSSGSDEKEEANKDFSEGPSYFVVTDASGRGEFRSKINNREDKGNSRRQALLRSDVHKQRRSCYTFIDRVDVCRRHQGVRKDSC